ncbi:MAG: SemiSWEET transporter [Cyanobacteria bacterium P01_D01_bin.123]
MISLHSPDTIGLLAGALTTVALLPQLVKTWRSQSAEDVSIGMFLLFNAGVVLWGVYGWEIHALPVILTNIVTFILAAAILTLKLIYDRRSRMNAEETARSEQASTFEIDNRVASEVSTVEVRRSP